MALRSSHQLSFQQISIYLEQAQASRAARVIVLDECDSGAVRLWVGVMVRNSSGIGKRQGIGQSCRRSPFARAYLHLRAKWHADLQMQE